MRSKRRKEFIPIISAIQELTVTIDAYPVSVDTGSFSVPNNALLYVCNIVYIYIYYFIVYICNMYMAFRDVYCSFLQMYE